MNSHVVLTVFLLMAVLQTGIFGAAASTSTVRPRRLLVRHISESESTEELSSSEEDLLPPLPPPPPRTYERVPPTRPSVPVFSDKVPANRQSKPSRRNTTENETNGNGAANMKRKQRDQAGEVLSSLPQTLVYEILPSADDMVTNTTRCSHTQLTFTKETLLHVWEIKGLIGYISYIKRFDQPFEVKTEHVSFKSDNVDGKWTFKLHKVRHLSPFSLQAATVSSTTAQSTASSAAYATPSDLGDIRIVATYSYEAKQPRNSDFIIRPTLIHGSKEVALPSQKSTSPTIVQQKFYNNRGFQLNTNFLEYVYTFTWKNVIQPLNEIKSGLFNSKIQHHDTPTTPNRTTRHENRTPPHHHADDPRPHHTSHHNPHHEAEASEEFFEEITRTDFSGHYGDITIKFIIEAYFPEDPVSVTSSRCNSSILDLVVSPNLMERLVPGKPGYYPKDVSTSPHGRPLSGGGGRFLGTPPYLRYANSMIYDDRFIDVLLVVGEDVVPAHRIILATSSPVFSAIMENTTLVAPSPENDNHPPCKNGSCSRTPFSGNLPRVLIEPADIGVDCVEEFLRYIYTGSVDNVKMKAGHLAGRLILLSDKYGLPELKRHCEGILLREMTADNAIEMYVLGKRVSSERMTRKALIVMKMNKAKLASQTEEFRLLSMQHPTLMYELFLSD